MCWCFFNYPYEGIKTQRSPPMRAFDMFYFTSKLLNVFLIRIMKKYNDVQRYASQCRVTNPQRKERGPQEFQVLEMTLLSSGQQPDVKVS